MDDDKIPTAPTSSCVVLGVTLSSRYQKQHELDTMAHAISVLPSDVLEQIVEIWCDSKATNEYKITLIDQGLWTWAGEQAVAEYFATALMEVKGGYNAIYAGNKGFVDADWGEV